MNELLRSFTLVSHGRSAIPASEHSVWPQHELLRLGARRSPLRAFAPNSLCASRGTVKIASPVEACDVKEREYR